MLLGQMNYAVRVILFRPVRESRMWSFNFCLQPNFLGLILGSDFHVPLLSMCIQFVGWYVIYYITEESGHTELNENDVDCIHFVNVTPMVH